MQYFVLLQTCITRAYDQIITNRIEKWVKHAHPRYKKCNKQIFKLDALESWSVYIYICMYIYLYVSLFIYVYI